MYAIRQIITKIEQDPTNYQKIGSNGNIIYIRNNNTEPLYAYIEAYIPTIIKAIIKTRVGLYCEPLNQQITPEKCGLDYTLLEGKGKTYIYIPFEGEWTIPITVKQIKNILEELEKIEDNKPIGLIKTLEHMIK